MKETLLQSDQNDLNEQTWHWIVVLSIGCAAASLLARVSGQDHAITQWIAFLAAGPAWYAAVRLLQVKTRFKTIRIAWLVWLSLAVVPMLLTSVQDSGFVIALLMSIPFLTFRLYRPYRILTSRQRIILGLLSLLFIVSLPGEIGIPEEAGWILHFIHQVGIWAIWSLKIYFGFTLVYLFFGMRLHFLRLKPKLMVTGFFLAVVPLALLATFSILSLINFLERDRAAIARRILETSAVELIQDEQSEQREHFLAEYSEDDLQITGTRKPAWLDSFLTAMRPDPTAMDTMVTAEPVSRLEIPAYDEGGGTIISIGSRTDTLGGMVWTPADTTMLFMIGTELWVLDVRGTDDDLLKVRGSRIDKEFIDTVASEVGSTLHILGTRFTDESRLDLTGFRNADERASAATDSSSGFHFGTMGFALVPIMIVTDNRMVTDTFILQVTSGPFQILRELTSGSSTMTQAMIAALASFAVFFLIIELGALFLGVRITRGFTSAVSLLHAGTKRLAAGDLDTRIEIENQDEFGDLADSFNEMAVAVKKGRDEAIARERLEKELETARSIQERLLPDHMPDVPGFEFAATSISSLQVGGDYFDFVETGTGQTGVVIADVSGKGIPAALLMANLQAALQGQAIHPGNVGAITGRVNNLLSKSSDVHMYATFFYGVLDRKSGRFTYCNAGHNPPIVQRASGEQEFLEVGGIPIGMMHGIAYEEETITIDPGDSVVMYTDGVSEAVGPDDLIIPTDSILPVDDTSPGTGGDDTDPAPVVAIDLEEDEDDDWADEGNMFEEERLYNILRKTIGKSALQIRDTIFSEVNAFCAGMPQSDDITVVVVRRQPETS
ncbi:PP2C family protein-serine/threonine phosphatase [Gemmatimonadota bacterium]